MKHYAVMLLFLRTGTYVILKVMFCSHRVTGYTVCIHISSTTHPHLCDPPGVLVLSILEAVFIESPNRLNLGSLLPTRPLTQGPLWMPIRMTTGLPSVGIITCRSSSRQDKIMRLYVGTREGTHSAACGWGSYGGMIK